MTGLLPLAGLKGLLAADPGDATGGTCRRCGAPLPADHRHVADIGARTLDCVCALCHAAGPAGGEAAGAPRRVPRRYLRLPEAAITEAQWEALDIPVGIAFFFHNSALGRSVASYPGPAGATESLLPPHAWDRVLRSSAPLRAMAPDVEALLVRRTHAARDCFVVPIDACYELAGRIRRRWSGFGGGAAVREEIEAFFTALRERSEAAP